MSCFRCYPRVNVPRQNLAELRFITPSFGEPSCVPETYKKKFTCGERGTRCVCDTGHFKYKKMEQLEDFHTCR